MAGEAGKMKRVRQNGSAVQQTSLIAVVSSFLAVFASPSFAAGSSPREDGARYGQAIGATLMCYKLETTDEFTALKTRYSGSELNVFSAEAEKIITAWRTVQTCGKAGGPNSCRLTQVWSCQEALREIGPNGSALPGLVRIKN
jgi:hypothetical protein